MARLSFYLFVVLFSIFTLNFPVKSLAQFNFIYNDSIPIDVLKNGDKLEHAWVGGLNNAQFSSYDYDFDGDDDLIIFDRSSNKILVFEHKLDNTNNPYYAYDFYASDVFPDDLNGFFLMLDYDGDGKKDIFTRALGGFRVFKNVGNSDIGSDWQLVENPVTADLGSFETTLFINGDEIPAFYDVDGDGDIDVLTFHTSMGRIEWYKNLSHDLYGHSDSLIFQLEQPCWGDFVESSLGNSIELDSEQFPCGESNSIIENHYNDEINAGYRHGAGTVLALDLNGSGLTDLILGDVEFFNLQALINGGTDPTENAFMNDIDVFFPSYNVSVDLEQFPAAFYEDVDFDGVKDLIVGTNASGLSNETESVWFYKNNGQNDNPEFSFQTESFLQGEMIENGRESSPVFVDVNGNGLLDLLVANNFHYRHNSSNYTSIHYYENTGTVSTPEFSFVTDNWQNFKNAGMGVSVRPTFADLDGDGDLDMIIGRQDGRLRFYENSGGANNPLNFNILQEIVIDNNGEPIDVGSRSYPQLFDLNQDGLPDLVLGSRLGDITYYENTGTTNNYEFTHVTDNLGGIELSTAMNPLSRSRPHFFEHDGEILLILGKNDGEIDLYNNVEGNLNDGDNFDLVEKNITKISIGRASAPFVTDLRDNGELDLFVGNELGGVINFIPGDTSAVLSLENFEWEENNTDFKVYPNPSNNGIFKVEMDAEPIQSTFTVRAVNALGKVLFTEEKSNYIFELNLSNYDAGLYNIQIIKEGETLNRKVVVR